MAQRNAQLTELRHTLDTCALELAYQKTCAEVEALQEAEKARYLRVQLSFLADENSDVQSRFIRNTDRICVLEKYNQGLQKDLRVISANFENAQSDIQLKSREVGRLKVELNSLHGVTMDSTKLLTEKLTLARELSSIRPELDHLRSQSGSYQSLLVEKLSLQQNLSAIQVELETEKRYTQRILAREGKASTEDAKSVTRIEALQIELTKERRDRQILERESQKASTESDRKETTLESRLDAFRTKLKSTKEQLKATQEALETAQAANDANSNRSKRPVNSTISLAKDTRKRMAMQGDADTIIGTPGGLPATKKSRRGSSIVGEKSAFSITPFLNRTASTAPESPHVRNASSVNKMNMDSEKLTRASGDPGSSSRPYPRDLCLDRDVSSTPMTTTLEDAKPSKINSRALPGRKIKAAPVLEQVAEEGATENDGSAFVDPEAPPKDVIIDRTPTETIEMKRKKRKLLGGGFGKNLFDEEDGDAIRDDAGLLGGVRTFGAPARGTRGIPKFGRKRAPETSMGSFGSISPLKKDRKGA